MKNTRIIAVLGLLLLAAITMSAAQKLDISGTWTLDKSRSFSNPPGLEQTMTIAHGGNEVKLDARLTIQGRDSQISESWTLDGTEQEFTPPGAPGGPKGKRKASWLPGGKGIIVEDQTVIKSPNGEVSQRTTRKYTLSADGGSLIVDYFIDRGEHSFEAKRVFVKR